jgi:hypothetical protein
LVTLEGIDRTDSEKTEAPVYSLETQFQQLTDPSVPAGIVMVDVALRSYFLTPASEPKLTTPDQVQKTIRVLEINKAPGPDGIPSRALKYFAQRAVSLPAQIFNAVRLTHHFLTVWKHT